MPIQQCGKGHFYDSGKYQFCPICLFQMKSAAPLSDEKTVGAETPLGELNERTIGYAALQSDANAKPVAGWVVCVSGPDRGRDWRICEGKNFVGRAADSDICIQDAGVGEKRHAFIVYDARYNDFLLVPGQGTIVYLNGALLTTAEKLKDDDEIKIGQTVLCFRSFCGGKRKWQDG